MFNSHTSSPYSGTCQASLNIQDEHMASPSLDIHMIDDEQCSTMLSLSILLPPLPIFGDCLNNLFVQVYGILSFLYVFTFHYLAFVSHDSPPHLSAVVTLSKKQSQEKSHKVRGQSDMCHTSVIFTPVFPWHQMGGKFSRRLVSTLSYLLYTSMPRIF